MMQIKTRFIRTYTYINNEAQHIYKYTTHSYKIRLNDQVAVLIRVSIVFLRFVCNV